MWKFSAIVFWFALSQVCGAAVTITWPTPNTAFLEGGDLASWVQPTASGKLESALFGCVRNNGRRFHEAIDIKPVYRDRRGEATDSIFAIMPGTVRYINAVAGNSSFGRYVAIEHGGFGDLPVYTLYAHMKDVDNDISVGTLVQAGTRIGTMGRSAGGYNIPRSRAHLHFEIGVKLTDDFQRWYNDQGYGSKNHHGTFNGMNLIGANPLHFFEAVRDGQFITLRDYFKSLPTAFSLRVSHPEVPDFVRRYPQLLTSPIPLEGLRGWDVDFTWYGLPKAWTPLTGDVDLLGQPGKITLNAYNESLLQEKCRRTLYKDGDEFKMGSSLKTILALLFGYY